MDTPTINNVLNRGLSIGRIRDVTESKCNAVIPHPRKHRLLGIPEQPHYEEREGVRIGQHFVLVPPPPHDQRHVESQHERHGDRALLKARRKTHSVLTNCTVLLLYKYSRAM